MFYKQKDSGGRIISIGKTFDNTALPTGFEEISKLEYNSLQTIFSMKIDTPSLTPLNENGEIIF